MQRTTIFLDRELLVRAQRHARREGSSVAQVVREALALYLSQGKAASPRLPSIAGQFASGCTDTSERVDALLWRDPHR